MAVTLQITDGTDTVDFNDASNLYLGSAFQMNVGDGAVSELIISGWANGVDTDAKAVISQRYNRLIRKGIRHYSERRIDNAVWLVWKPDDQTDTQYAKVMGGGEVEIVTHTIGGQGGGVFAPSVIREGGWRNTAPDGTAGAAIWTAQSLYNKSDADGNNWADIAAARVNDVPSLLRFTIDPTSGTLPDRAVIAIKRGEDATFLNKFNPRFNATDLANNGGGTLTADTTAPGDERLELTADGTPYWTIADTDLIAYRGNYSVYVLAYIGTGTGTAQIRFETDYQTGEYKELSSSATQNLIYLGNFNIPGTAFNPFVTLTTGSDVRLKLGYDELTGTGTAYIKEMFLIPNETPPFECTFAIVTGDEVVIDGVNKLVYIVDSSGDQKMAAGSGAESTARGRYPVSIGGDVNRVFFYFWGDPNGGYLTSYDPNLAISVDLEIVDRFMGLRGAS